MTILVTGANGNIGIDIIRKLSFKEKIIAIYRTKNDKIKKIKNVTWIKHNLEKKLKIKLSSKLKCIIHSAINQKNLDKEKYIFSNTLILNNLIEFGKKNKAHILVNLSSIDIYGDIKKKIVSEQYKPRKPNLYGVIKHILERQLSNQELNFISIRLPGVLCKTAESKKKIPWLKSIIMKLSNNKEITIYNPDTNFNNVISTNEIANFIEYLLKKKPYVSDNFNFASSKPEKLKVLLSFLKKKLNSKSLIIEKKNSQNNSFYISVKKLRDKFKYQIPSTKEVLEKYLLEFEKND